MATRHAMRARIESDADLLTLVRGDARVEPNESIGEIPRPAAGIDIAQPNEKVGVRVVDAHDQIERRGTDDLEVLGKWRAGERDDVFAGLELSVVLHARMRRIEQPPT